MVVRRLILRNPLISMQPKRGVVPESGTRQFRTTNGAVTTLMPKQPPLCGIEIERRDIVTEIRNALVSECDVASAPN